MDWTIEYRDGLHLPQVDWWLDSRRPVPRSFVSHAHFDHLGFHKEILCTAPTARLMRERMPRKRIEHVLPLGHAEALTEDCAITLLPAGHILGSAQCLLQHEQLGSLLYTGDFKLRPSLIAEPCATPHADVLIMETTFGRPQYAFPPPEKVRDDMVAFCRKALEEGITPVLMAYSLGKCQEALAHLGSANAPIMLHPQPLAMTRIHETFGCVFPPYRDFKADDLPGHIVLCPPLSQKSGFLKQIPKRRTAFISGWALDRSTIYRQRCDAAFPLSDHADYPDLLRFVELVQPRRVLTLHGFAADFAATLRERGIDALALGVPNQLSLGL
ncbi:MAG: MBL fold metallo-hydrolase RNA specificity domain-containing protein [Opitutaceae bacterium]|jgi:Cft2 family RNA processing exonuclease